MAFDIGQNLRMRRIFESLFNPTRRIGTDTPSAPPVIPIPDVQSPLNPPDTSSDLRKLRLRTTPDIDAYKSYLQSAPDPKNYQQGKVGKILSAVAGFTEGVQKGPVAGVTTAHSLMRRPYEEAQEEYKSKGGRLKDLAELEYRGLTDDQKLAVQIANDELAQRKEMREWLKTNKDMKLTDAQIENLQNQVKTRGLHIEKNTKTGDLEIVDVTKGTRQSLGQFAESIEEASKREFEEFKKKEDVQQAGRKELQNDQQAHAVFMEGLRDSHDKGLAQFKHDLTKDDPTPYEKNTAYEGAVSQILLEHPQWKAELFTTGSDGKPALKKEGEYNPDVYATFIDAVKLRKNRNLGYDTIPGPGTGFKGQPNVTLPKQEAPPVSIPEGTVSKMGATVDVISPTGEEGTIPMSQLAEALAEGYKRK